MKNDFIAIQITFSFFPLRSACDYRSEFLSQLLTCAPLLFLLLVTIALVLSEHVTYASFFFLSVLTIGLGFFHSPSLVLCFSFSCLWVSDCVFTQIMCTSLSLFWDWLIRKQLESNVSSSSFAVSPISYFVVSAMRLAEYLQFSMNFVLWVSASCKTVYRSVKLFNHELLRGHSMRGSSMLNQLHFSVILARIRTPILQRGENIYFWVNIHIWETRG